VRLLAPFDLPRPRDVPRSEELQAEQWATVTRVATLELARRARPALPSYVVLLGLAFWGSGVFERRTAGEGWTVAVVGGGLLVAGILRHLAIRQPLATVGWWRRYGLLTVVHAALNGALGAAMTLQLGLRAPALIYWLVLAGLAAGATTGLTPSPVLGRVFIWISLAPLAIAATWVSVGTDFALPCVVAVYMAFMTVQAGWSTRAYWDGIISGVLLREQARELEAARLAAQEALVAQDKLLRALQTYRDDAERDYAVAARIFAGILERCCFKCGSIRATISPLERFNGDLVMAAAAPGGCIRLFLGDFTGHGLSAAVGALPVAEVFFATTAQGVPLQTVLRDMNATVRRILPRGLFLAAFVAELEPRSGRMAFWNGGLPEPFVVDRAGLVTARLSSRDLPLGVLSSEEFGPSLEGVVVPVGERLFAYSDGVIETANPQGDLFGTARLEQALARAPAAGLSEGVRRSLDEHRQGSPNKDDVTLLELQNDELLIADLRAYAPS
jgi:serine phosphatase RsbU (regulator of sigma subunit)